MISRSMILLLLLAAVAGTSRGQNCDATDAYFPDTVLNTCRTDRQVGGIKEAYLRQTQFPYYLTQASCTTSTPSVSCNPATDANCQTYSFSKVDIAEQACMAKNKWIKDALKECVAEGITFKKNYLCPPSDPMRSMHQMSSGGFGAGACELRNPTVTVDAGNSQFYSCVAIGPGPMTDGPFATLPAGCCRLGKVNIGDANKEFNWEEKQLQWMELKEDGLYWTWKEDYLKKFTTYTIFGCNPSTVKSDYKTTHTACLFTGRDLMIEGFSNPTPSLDHSGPGWCSITTGYHFEDTTLPQLGKDLMTVVSHIAGTKGIKVPADPNNYDTTDEEFACFTHKKNFNDHCMAGQLYGMADLAPHLGFAHSMGAMTAAAWDIPIQQFGGSVPGPTGGVKNNCDPIPWVVSIGHRVALSFMATQTAPGGAPVGGTTPYTYKLCQELINAGQPPMNCVNANGSYNGTPEGPSNCWQTGNCKWRPWCGANPYEGSPYNNAQHYTGRTDFRPKQCRNTIADDLKNAVRQCLDSETGLDLMLCIKNAFDTATLVVAKGRDHLFDGNGEGDGYRPITGANWGRPKRFTHEAFQVCDPGWQPAFATQSKSCCTVGLQGGGAACTANSDCCTDGVTNATCVAGSCQFQGKHICEGPSNPVGEPVDCYPRGTAPQYTCAGIDRYSSQNWPKVYQTNPAECGYCTQSFTQFCDSNGDGKTDGEEKPAIPGLADKRGVGVTLCTAWMPCTPNGGGTPAKCSCAIDRAPPQP